MIYQEYAFGEGKQVDLGAGRVGFIDTADYSKAHQILPIITHDVMINYNGGILLLVRDNSPAKNLLWPVGGRLQRFVPMEKSLRECAKRECNLKVGDLEVLGLARQFFRTDPFRHGKGTDTPSILFYGRGTGEIKLDRSHNGIKIITPEEYTESFKASLHPYVRDFLDIAMEKLIRDIEKHSNKN